MSEKQARELIEKYVREALAIRAKKKVSEAAVKRVTKEIFHTATKTLRAA